MRPTTYTEYDEVPYDDLPIVHSKPEKLAAIAALFGLNSPDLATARILDLGCGSGINVIRFAADFPNAQCIGIDLSRRQIEHGKRYVDELGLKNIELKAMSIMDIDNSFGKFDYIICHGVFSWVPADVRNKILEICSKNLTENGLAYVSYNTLPGWNMNKTMRDMMQYHASSFTNIADKVNQAKSIINFASDALSNKEDMYARFLKTETDTLNTLSLSYLRHEYLGEENTAFYFHDFMNQARINQLIYVGDSSLEYMYAGNLSSIAAEQITGINDIVRSEQYMDFINNRRFRKTILCHNDALLNRNIDMAKLDKLYFLVQVEYEGKLADIIIKDGQENKFKSSNLEEITTRAALETAIFVSVLEHPGQFLSLDEITQYVSEKGVNSDKATIKISIAALMAQLIFKGIADISIAKPKAVYKISTKPTISNLAKIQLKMAQNADKISVTSQTHNALGFDNIAKEIIYLVDGTRSLAQIVSDLVKVVQEKQIEVKQNGVVITNVTSLQNIFSQLVPNYLNLFARQNLLVQ